MSLFRLDSSIQGPLSVSRAIADTFVSEWLTEHPDSTVVQRDLALDPIPAVWGDAATAGYVPEEHRSPAQRDALALATSLADEFLAAEAYVLAVPLYNWSVPNQVKLWVDMLITDPRLSPVTAQTPLAGRTGVIVVSRGGSYAPGTPKAGWDAATPWLRNVFGDNFGLDLSIVEAELTLADKVPAMESLRPLAETSLRTAHEDARRTGREHARRQLQVQAS